MTDAMEVERLCISLSSDARKLWAVWLSANTALWNKICMHERLMSADSAHKEFVRVPSRL